jgi:protein-S-isoprenylcysteine O-methyltransferase Ste14
MVIGALAFAKWAIKTFKEAGTNVPPNMPATTIVTTGPFKYSRNPMYLSMLVLYAGMAMLADAPLMLLLTGGLFAVLNNKVIKAEESYLEAKFGEDYLAYKARVHRWITPDL